MDKQINSQEQQYNNKIQNKLVNKELKNKPIPNLELNK